MNSDPKQPSHADRWIAQVLAPSRARREAAQKLRPDIEAAEKLMRDAARDALAAGYIRHLGQCGVPETLLEALQGSLKSNACVEGVARWLAQTDQPFLVLTGGAGAGKSLAAARCLSHARRLFTAYAHPLADEPVTVEEYDARDGMFITAAALHYAKRFSDTPGPSLLDRAALVRWLVLDELRAEDLKGAGKERLEEVLGERYACQRRTVITTNLAAKELSPLLGERLASRFAEAAMVVDAGDDDLRRQR